MALDLGLDRIQAQLDKVSRLPSHYRLAVICVVPVLLVAGYWYFLHRASVEEHNQLVGKQQQLQRKLNEVRSVAANIEAFEQELEELENELKMALRQLPNSKELPGLLTDITNLGKKAGLEFTAFRPKGEGRKGFYAEVPIELEFTGTYHQVGVFFDRIAKLDRIVNVGDMEMKVARETLGETVLEVKGRAITFRFLEEGGDA